MIASQLGYRLLLGLLTGEAVRLDSGHCLGPYPLADLVVVGYGARGTEPRCRYPFETRIVEALVARRPLYPPARTAVLFEKSDPDVVGWYHQNGFNVAPHGEFDLVTTVRRVISA